MEALYEKSMNSKAEEDLHPRLNGNPFQDNQLCANHYTINLFEFMVLLL